MPRPEESRGLLYTLVIGMPDGLGAIFKTIIRPRHNLCGLRIRNTELPKRRRARSLTRWSSFLLNLGIRPSHAYTYISECHLAGRRIWGSSAVGVGVLGNNMLGGQDT